MDQVLSRLVLVAFAAMQFFGDIAIMIGLFARPVALTNALMLTINLRYHVPHPYGDAFLTQAGIEALGARRYSRRMVSPEFADGGGTSLSQAQHKTEFLYQRWTVSVLFFAGYDGGPLSVDERIGRQF